MDVIQIDERIGSRELAQYLPEGSFETVHLDFGDFAWVGRGIGGEPYPVGVERKTIGDLISCIKTGRFSGHQLPGLLNTYKTVYLIVEGLMQCSPTNEQLCTRWGSDWIPVEGIKGSAVIGYLNTIAVMGGVIIWHTGSPRETTAYLMALHDWWTKKDLDKHRSHLQIRYKVPTFIPQMSLVRRIAAELPGIGHDKSGKVEEKFGSVRRMINAEEKEWMEIEGVGKTIAKNIKEAIQ